MQYLQIALPVALILWLAIWPLRGRARLVHLAMTTAMHFVMILALQWLWPSAYAPLGLIALLVIAALFGRRRSVDRRNSRLWPGMVAGLITVFAASAAVWLVTARLRPAVTLELTFPFSTAAVVTEGGTSLRVNRHRRVLNADSPSLSGWQGMADAVTLRPVDQFGRPLTAAQTVVAPCDGAVVESGNDTRLGAFVILDCAGQWIVLSGLDAVTARGQLAAGQVMGTAIALTLHAQGPGTPAHLFSGKPAPISVNGTFPVRGFVLRP